MAPGDLLLSCCPLLVGRTAWTFVFSESIGPSLRVRACVPAAVSDEVEVCGVLNVRNGETQTYVMTDRRPLRERMEL